MTIAASALLLMLSFSVAVALAALLRFKPIIAAVALVPCALIAACALALVP